jgi:hypothetical protein
MKRLLMRFRSHSLRPARWTARCRSHPADWKLLVVKYPVALISNIAVIRP